METNDDENTPVELVPRASPERRSITNLGLAVLGLGDDILETARRWDSATDDERRAAAVSLSIRLGEAAEIFHDARRLVRDYGS